MKSLLVAAAAFVLLVTTASAADDNDAFAMMIDAGRLSVMMDQAQRMLNQPATEPSGSSGTFAILKNAVRAYENLAPVACNSHAASPELCASLYKPSWLDEADSAALPQATLRSRIDEASDPVASLWSALCAKQPAERDPSLCQIE